VCCGSEVTSVGRGGIGKGKSIGGGDRLSTPFRLLVRDTGTGAERFVEGIDVLVDASGTYGNHKWLGKGGIPALGERALAASGKGVCYTLPDLLGAAAETYSGGGAGPAVTTAVVGCGASAITSLSGLRTLAAERGGVGVVWVTQRTSAPYTVLDDDPLPQRDALNRLGNSLAAEAGGGGGGGGGGDGGDGGDSGDASSAFASFEYKDGSQVLGELQAPTPVTHEPLHSCDTRTAALP
jgi:hypothetical protein